MWHRVMCAGAVTDHDKAGVPAISMYHQPWWGLSRVLGSDGDGMLSVADNELHRSRVYSWMNSSHVLINYGPFLSLQSVPSCPSLAVAYHVCPLSGQRNLCSDFPFSESTRWYITSYRGIAPCTLHLASFSESPAEVWAYSFWAALHFMSPLTSVYLLLGRVVSSFSPLCKNFWECSCKSLSLGVYFWFYKERSRPKICVCLGLGRMSKS